MVPTASSSNLFNGLLYPHHCVVPGSRQGHAHCPAARDYFHASLWPDSGHADLLTRVTPEWRHPPKTARAPSVCRYVSASSAPSTSQPLRVCHVPDRPTLDIEQYAAEPLSVEAMLEVEVLEKMQPSCRDNRRQLLPNFGNFANCLRLSGDSCSQQIRNQG